MIKNQRLLNALKKQPVDATPIWVMRQAGRYLPEYRQLRKEAGSFMTLCRTPALACEVTLQPLRRFDLDAAILFSDILTIPDAMGLGLYFVTGEGPCFKRPLTTSASIKQLSVPDPELELGYVMEAVKKIKISLENKLPLIGFSGSPWTLAAYMLEGSSKKGFSKILQLKDHEPALLHTLLSTLTQAVTAYLQAQINAGVDVVMLFDTWGNLLSPADYREFSLGYMKNIITQLSSKVPSIIFTKDSQDKLEDLAQSGCSAVSVDWTIPLTAAYQRIGDKVALQGNLDPAVLKTTPDNIRHAVKKVLDVYQNKPGHIFNLGHGITPDVPPEHVSVMVEAVHELSRRHD